MWFTNGIPIEFWEEVLESLKPKEPKTPDRKARQGD